MQQMTTLASSKPQPRPLCIGEHVLCTLSPSSSDSAIHAVVVALDKAYEQAAAHFLALPPSSSSGHAHGAGPNHASVIDSSSNSDHDVQPVPDHDNSTVDTDDELRPYPVDQTPTKILFREADSRPYTYQPSPPKAHHKKRRHVMPANVEALVSVSRSIKPDDTPAPHPITSGRVYVHFSGRDRRLDRWASAVELKRASASHVAAAASGVVANTLLDNAAAVDFAAAGASINPEPKLTRARRRAYEQVNPTSEKEIGNEAVIRMEKDREEKTKVRNVSTIVFGNYSIDAWYFSPFPLKHPVEVLYMCGKCLMYVRTCRRFVQHCTKCDWIDAPGLLIYEDTARSLRVFEVSGVINPDYCQRLCLLGKLFLDHKTLFFDVTPFLFYIATLGGELAGFFSKEHPLVASEHNLACIVTLPPHQKKGIGRFLISLSYELTKRERKTGSPERPLSDLGQVSYRSYWAYAIMQYLESMRDEVDKVPAKTISEVTGIGVSDVVETLKSLQLVYMWRGETNAEVSSRALDSALQRVSSPRLPLHEYYLKRTSSSLRVDIDSPLTMYRPTELGNSGHHRQLRSNEGSVRRPVLPQQFELKPEPELLERSKDSHRIMEEFVRKHGKDRILARLNSPGGLSSDELSRLAQEVRLTDKYCRKHLLRQAREENGESLSLRDSPRTEHRTVDIQSIFEGSGFENGGFMLGDSVRRERHPGLPSTVAQGEESTSLSDRDGVKFVDSTVRRDDDRQLQIARSRGRARQVDRDMDVVVIDS